MTEFNHIDKNITPNSVIIKNELNEYTVLKFETTGDEVNLMETSINVDYMGREDIFNDFTVNDILYAKLAYDFSFSEDEGMMELILSGKGSYESPIYKIIETNIEDFFNLYLQYIEYIKII